MSDWALPDAGDAKIQLDDVRHVDETLELGLEDEIVQHDSVPGLFNPPARGDYLIVGRNRFEYLDGELFAREYRRDLPQEEIAGEVYEGPSCRR